MKAVKDELFVVKVEKVENDSVTAVDFCSIHYENISELIDSFDMSLDFIKSVIESVKTELNYYDEEITISYFDMIDMKWIGISKQIIDLVF